MSTKTLRKRISLIAVVAVAFSGLTMVAANAANIITVTTASVTSSPAASISAPAAVGTPITADINVASTANMANTDVLTFTLALTDPNGTVVTSSLSSTAVSGAIATNATAASAGANVITLSATGAANITAGVKIGTVTFTPKMGGVYQLTSVTTIAGASTNTTQTELSQNLYVTGYGANVASSGVGTTTIGAVTGGIAKVKFGTAAHASGDVYTLISSGVGQIQTVAAGTGSPTVVGIAASSDWTQGAKVTTSANTNFNDVLATVASTVAGTQTLTWTTLNATTGSPTVVASATITWGAAPAISAGYTAAASFIDSGTAVATVNGTVVFNKSVPAAFNSTSTGATISVHVKDGSNLPLTGQPLTVSVSGPGLVSIQNSQTTGTIGTVRAASLTASQMASSSDATIGVTADGTAGTSTITVSSGTTTLFTKTVIFYGTVATLTATQNLSIASVAGAALGTATAAPTGLTVATTPAVIIVAKDANGNVVPGLTITAKSSDTTVIASGTVVESNGAGAGDAYAGPGSYNASVTSSVGTSGASTTVVFRTLLSDGVTYITTSPVTFTLGGKASTATYSAALDKASYSAGDAATLTISAKDSAGNPIFDQDVNLWGGLGTAPVWSKAVVGLTPSASATATFVGGKHKYTGYAPSLSGDFSISGVIDAATVPASGTVTASATVAGQQDSSLALDAANAATDAANNAYDEAQNATQAASDALAAVQALAVQVKALIALVTKIKNKIGA